MRERFQNSSPGALTLEQARALEIKRQRERRRQAEEHGIPFDRLRVGSRGNSINPNTGVAEFDPNVVPGGPTQGITVTTSRWPDFGLPTLPMSWIGFAPEELDNGDPSESWYAPTGPGGPIDEVVVTAPRLRGSQPSTPNPNPPRGSRLAPQPMDPGMLPGITVGRLVPLPQNIANNGYYNYGTPGNGQGQFGTPETVNLIGQVGQAWQDAGNKPFGVGNISLPGGGQFTPHRAHQNGLGIDIRPVRTDGAQVGDTTFSNAAYDRAATQRLIDQWRSTGAVNKIYFNDPLIRDVFPLSGHDNHFHVELDPSWRPAR